MLLRRRMSRLARATVNVAGSMPWRLTFERRELAGPDAEQAHRETSHFAAQSSAGTERRNASAVETDPPAEKEIGRDATAGAQAGARASGKRERAEVLQEEIPFFGKEQVEPREVHLLLVHLDLREIGVGRDVDGQDSVSRRT